MSRPGLDRDLVVAAAVELADEDGLDAVTLARVAAALGVRTPSLYHHVDGLHGLRRGIALVGLRELGTVLRTATMGRSGADALAALAHAYRAGAARHPGAYAATQRTDLLVDDELRAASARAIDVVFAVLRAWETDEARLVDLVRAVRSGLHGFVALEADRGFAIDASRDDSFEVLVRILVAGLDAHAAAAAAG